MLLSKMFDTQVNGGISETLPSDDSMEFLFQIQIMQLNIMLE